LRRVDFPTKRKPEEAWPDFVGWRVNYEQAAYAIARELEAVPALWSGPRRHEDCPAIPPVRPPEGRMAKKKSEEGPFARKSEGGSEEQTAEGS
jgi:hypothetical protein